MEQGRIIKGVGGFYEVSLPGGTVTCSARGRFRREGVAPMVGDLVEILPQHDGLWAIERILPRRNAFVRPPVSNIDQLILVVAASAPKPDWLLVDKMILQAKLCSIDPLLVLNKTDEITDSIGDAFQRDYGAYFHTLWISSRTGEGMDLLRSCLPGKVSCFAGQSAVGKSSLLNALLPELKLPVGTLAKKTDRGKHTTRHAELWPYQGGALLDTPGFSLLDAADIPAESLSVAYPEFGDAPSRCRFAGCSHINEPDCGVKALLHQGRMSPDRYERYRILYEEIEQRRKHRYD